MLLLLLFPAMSVPPLGSRGRSSSPLNEILMDELVRWTVSWVKILQLKAFNSFELILFLLLAMFFFVFFFINLAFLVDFYIDRLFVFFFVSFCCSIACLYCCSLCHLPIP